MLILFQDVTTTTTSGLERMLDKYGWPGFILILVILALFAISRAVWPLLKAYVLGLQKALDDMVTLFKNQLELANSRAATDRQEFLTHLEEQRKSRETMVDNIARKHSETIEAVTKKNNEAMTEQIVVLKQMAGKLDNIQSDVLEIKRQKNG